MIQTLCDGCGRVVKSPTIEAHRADGNDGCSPLPSTDAPLQWCANCSLVAVGAVIRLRDFDEGFARQHAAFMAAKDINPYAVVGSEAIS